jgi:Fur family transcriptional regulator, stress-responsive regulator
VSSPTPLVKRLRDRGWRVTAQRRAVAEVLVGEHVHFTAEDVHARARVVVPEISLATVYNTLGELVAMGEVLEVRASRGPVRYDPNVHTAHHHLVCTGCGALLDVTPTGIENVVLSTDEAHGFVVDDVDVTFRGRCADCR